ncbi:exodeoxyribonuclease V [Synergistales bacterium]|nr:exodeoxyribonuclease V [Synergistales bacterium]
MTDYIDTLLPEDTPIGQRSAVLRDDGLMTVEAGAGTGKTWTLSSRFARLLLSPLPSLQPCLPKNILTLTYTEAAAREMQERIRKKTVETINLIGSGQASQGIDKKSIKDGFDDAWISTIHSFSARLIRESGLSLDIDPYSTILSPSQEDSFWLALARALDTMSLSRFAHSLSHDLRAAAGELEKDGFLIAALEKWTPSELCALAHDVAELHASMGHDDNTLLKWAAQAESRSDPQSEGVGREIASFLSPVWHDTWKRWRLIFQEIEDELEIESQKAKGSAGALRLASVARKWIDKMSEEDNKEIHKEDQMLFFVDICDNLSGTIAKSFKEKIEDMLGQKISEWKAQKKERGVLALSAASPLLPLSENEQRLRATLLRFCAFAWSAWEETKRRRDIMSFGDLIRFAALSVSKDSGKKDFRHIMIDEFQDTDPLQDAMLRALREKEGANLFLVGDPKQAIYRFRHADLTLFADYVKMARASNSEVRLGVSFRTRSVLLERINSLFAHIWQNGLGSDEKMKELKFEPLTAHEANGEGGRPDSSVKPVTLVISVTEMGNADAADELLARKLARLFAAWKRDCRTVWDKKERKLRPVRWRDFAVLSPSRTKYSLWETVFAEEGIPVVLEKGKSYFARGEVTDIVNTLKAAAFPDDEASLAGWLSSPFSGVARRDVEACIELKKNERPLSALLSEHLPEADARISVLRRLGALRGPSAVLSRLLEDRRWLSRYNDLDRARVTANVAHALSLARQYESGVSPSLIGCADWLGAALSSMREMTEPEWIESGADAVHVMTVHGSKGLEFPVVAVVNMNRGLGRNNTSQVTASKKMGVAVSSIPDMMAPDDAKPPNSLKWERLLSERAELEESQRLFYVAATRAQDSLILCGKINETQKGKTVTKDSWLSWTLEWLEKEEGMNWQDIKKPYIIYASPDESGASPAKNHAQRASVAREAAPKPLSLPSSDIADMALASFSATSFALFEWCPFAWRRKHRQGVDLRWEIPEEHTDGGGHVGGSELGLLAHWILARWDMRVETLSKWLGEQSTVLQILPSELRDTWRGAKNKKTLEEWLVSFAASGEGHAISSALARGELLRENAFSLPLTMAEGEAHIKLVGATDAIWKEGTRWHVRDYKITTQNNAPAELYRSQLAFYALATRLMCRDDANFGGVDVALVFLREGGEIGERKTFGANGAGDELESEFDALRNQVGDAARGAALGPWVPMREHCRSCPWRKKCPKS